MGKATRWLKGLLGMKKDKENVDNLGKFKERRENKRWSFSVSEKHHSESNTIIDHSVWLRSFVSEREKEQNRHAIAVAAATAAAADAAAAAAQAAVAVVRLTNQGRVLMLNGKRENIAAVKIQAVFRGSLSRKALRALKGLVKLQALVRGYLVRKRAAATLHSMQALFRAQFAVCSQRALLSSNNNNRHSKYPPNFRARRLSMEKMEECRSEYNHSRRLSASYEYDPSFNGLDEIPSPKIIGIDTCKHKTMSRRIHTCISDSGGHHHYPIPCPNSARLSIPCYPRQLDECCRFSTAQNTPRFVNSGMSEAPATPTRSVGSGGDGYFQRYSNNYPSYMANTQSFEAKSRSHSAPKQRVEMMLTRKRLSLNEMMASRLSFTGVRMQRPCSQVEED